MESVFAKFSKLELTKKFTVPISIFALMGLLAIGFSSFKNKNTKFPEQVNGVIDLRYYSITSNTEPIPLKGEWEFYWQEFIFSDPSSYSPQPLFLKTQETWADKDIGHEILGRNGYASYALNILLPVDHTLPEMGLFIPQIASSYRLYLNRKLIHQSGEVSRDREKSNPFMKNIYLPIPLSEWDKNIELVFEISNYENNNPGFWGVPMFGPMETIHKVQVFSTANDLFLFGALVIMGFYHWGIYFFHKSQKSILFFSAFSYLLALRVITTGERYLLELFPMIDWELIFRLEFFSLFLLPMSFSIYVYYLFPMETKKNLIHCVSLITGLFLALLIFPIHIYTMSFNLFLIFIFVVILYLLYVNVKAVINKREDASLFLLGIVVVASASIWDILQDLLKIRGMSLSPYGFLVFVFIQALVLSSRLASNFSRNEKLTNSLSKSNQELTFLKRRLEERVEERTQKLKDSISVIRKDLDIAKSIQTKLIPRGTSFWNGIKVSTMYQPMEEVGGDIFDIDEIGDGKIRIFLADALGHGVQAALLTMAIKSEYEGIKDNSHSPAESIRNLSESFLKKFASLQTYFSAVVVDIDTNSRKLIFASAGHPDQLLLAGGRMVPIVPMSRTAHIIGLDKQIEVSEISYDFNPGDRLYLYSDGAYEQFNKSKEIMGEPRLFSHFQSFKADSLENSIETLTDTIKEFLAGGRLQDDLTVIGIEKL
ncbi:MAG: SpoIIE family protein phosphatase [Leptospira sp.]|nr:SpoIIE family protein phosphatase [Leptospira sp.]